MKSWLWQQWAADTRVVWGYELPKRLELFQMSVAWHLPRWLVKWAAVRLVAHATTGRFADTVVPDLSAVEALKRWDENAPELDTKLIILRGDPTKGER